MVMRVSESVYVKMLKGFLVDLPTPVNLNYWFGFGVSLGMIYVVQVVSGLVLSLFYSVGADGSFWEVVYIMQEVSYGWLIRFVHSSGVSIFFICLYLHTFRGLIYGGFSKPMVWVSGLVILLMVMAVSFLGYVLPWGSMSYWGMTVVTSMLGAIPYVGVYLMEWLWGGSSAGVGTLSRFFSLHYLLGLGVSVVAIYHMVSLHDEGSSNPLGVSSGLDKVDFHELFTYKDVLGLVVVLVFYWVLVMCYPYLMMDSANFEEVSFVKTPLHIKPEWYFLFVYCILRSVSSKLGGVILMVMAIVGLMFLVVGGGKGVYRKVGFIYWKLLVIGFGVSFVCLTIMGGEMVEYPYELVGFMFTIIYFMSLVVMVGVGSLGVVYKVS
uniref:cytochrome b n=1 Tax=Corynosoma villosum TaxID=141829 RepID=UPI002E75F2D1|nr:cytochrome b [Corynosoma villosum]WPN89824.1 cytochrome b [Corynosoma villosum]